MGLSGWQVQSRSVGSSRVQPDQRLGGGGDWRRAAVSTGRRGVGGRSGVQKAIHPVRNDRVHDWARADMDKSLRRADKAWHDLHGRFHVLVVAREKVWLVHRAGLLDQQRRAFARSERWAALRDPLTSLALLTLLRGLF